jgi:UDP-N-acetylmuramoyl-L-alanyl-D-glutamate--2,6-diaminopimelate ligase
MQLCELISNMNLTIVRGDDSCDVIDLTDDSRSVTAGSVFVARPRESQEGGRFIAEAIAKGAIAIVSNQPPNDTSAAWVQGQLIDQALAGRLAERFFGEPAKKLKLIGVTGTNGKTTTAYIVQHLLKSAAMHCGLIGTIHVDDGNTKQIAALTTPGAIELSRLLARMVDNGCQAVVLEVSSHALKQGRTTALSFDVAVFTNLTGDHLDYHNSMDDYLASKALLFNQLDEKAVAVVNADDVHHERIIAACCAKVLRCSLTRDDVSCRASAMQMKADGSRARFTGPWGQIEATTTLVGKYNLHNTLEALAAAHAISPINPDWVSILENCPAVPGRLELVSGLDNAPTVFVDYAHTHDALENVLTALRPTTGGAVGRLMVLFGCGGDRDRTKRARMAEVACRLADVVMITSDNPRTEDPSVIIDDILQGADDNVVVEPDRAKAIAMIIESAGSDDVVLIAGKGHEDSQIIGTDKHHFDDREQAAAVLSKR